MFDKLFGWRKASKCKKLIGKVQCRLKLLKNKRSCIARQLREDLGVLFRDGHHLLVFNRVEQLFLDENLVAVYEILHNYCEFIIIHLPYIRKHKDCPNDINEAVSTLIYASARLGDLPELLSIRNLFAQRYGQRFAKAALDLLPGNLVNHQIKENLSLKCVTDEVKYKLVDEITRSCFRHGPLLLGYTSEWQNQENKVIDDQVSRIDVEISDSRVDEQKCSKPAGEYAGWEGKKWSKATRVSSKMRYVDEIAEFESNGRSIDPYWQDQRLFVFNSPCLFTFIVYKEKENAEMMSECEGGEESGEESSADSWERKQKHHQPPYIREITMPFERAKESVLDSISRSISFPVEQLGHVHPKLPDYDEISAKFMALKRERILNKCHQNPC